MRKAAWLALILAGSTLVYGQTSVDLRTQSKSVDFSGANGTTPFQTGAALPPACSVGQMFYLTAAPAGANVYGCTATNSWTAQKGQTLPDTTGNSGKVLSTDGANLLWTGLSGDASGSAGALTVTRIQGFPVAPTAPAQGQILTWSATDNKWEPQNAPAASGGGGSTSGGATMASQLGDLQVVRTNATTLTIGSNCSFSTPCNARLGAVTYSFTSSSTITLSGGTGFAYIYVSSAGQWIAGQNSLTLSCGNGCTAQSGVTAFPTDSIPLFSWSATNGQWDALGLDQRAFLSSKNILAGTGITVTDSSGQTTVAADSSVVPLRVAVPAASSSACNAGTWAADTNFYYFCVSQNAWKRAALTSF